MKDIFKKKHKTIKVKYLPKEWTVGYRPPQSPVKKLHGTGRKKMEEEKKTAPVSQPGQVQIEIDEQTAQGAYANLAMITHNETEFVFDFIYVQPQAPKAKVRSRIITSPLHAKRFLKALEDNLKKYEAHFGQLPEIKEVEKPIAFA
jgi:hypothetical protein